MSEKIFAEAINEAIAEEMRRDENVFIMGEDIRLSVYGATANLLNEFGEDRVLDTPLSENGFFGAAIGASLVGMRPIVETVTSMVCPGFANAGKFAVTITLAEFVASMSAVFAITPN